MIWGNSDPCHPSLVCTGGSKMADFEVKIRSQWQGHPGTLESTWKLLNASMAIFDPPVHTGEGWQGSKRHLTMFSY